MKPCSKMRIKSIFTGKKADNHPAFGVGRHHSTLFNLTSLAMFGARAIDDSMPNTKAYVERVSARPAYQKAMSITGPEAVRPG
ncbi:MAG: hypothetical protein V7742_00515 [Halioglobus sp.]